MNTLLQRIQSILDVSLVNRNIGVPVLRETLCEVRDALKQPIMPEHPSDELLNAMSQFYGDRRDYNAKRYEALRAALTTPPKPKMKTVWKFSYTFTPHNENRVYVTDHSDAEADVRKYHKNVCDNARANKYTNISPIWSEEVEDK
ncbi:hypothetical protein UFOVP1323_62 [uncultured Caudovirales phage]|uniref:Uncharacterized protein n=1 Tax=uncultured Caudovirales phage TaxID=2100421 RepID=A0A6J5RWV3_9CAUD|nr:hypothetical protein UFOVP1323_62 [uncultured Caudovirales phage]